MKKVLLPILFFSLFAILFSSCKDDNVDSNAASLEGDWAVISVAVNGVEQSFSDMTYTMVDCPAGNRCSGVRETLTSKEEVEYMLSEDGTQFFLFYRSGGSSPDDQVFDVDEHTHASFVISELDPSSSDVTVTTMHKVQ